MNATWNVGLKWDKRKCPECGRMIAVSNRGKFHEHDRKKPTTLRPQEWCTYSGKKFSSVESDPGES